MSDTNNKNQISSNNVHVFTKCKSKNLRKLHSNFNI